MLNDVANVDLEIGDYGAAAGALVEALAIFHKLGHRRGVARGLALLSFCASRQNRDETAVRLASAAAAVRLRIGAPLRPLEHARIDETLAQARERIDPEAYAAAWREGRTATMDSILASEAGARRPAANY